jgi:hypothetical protein
VILLGAKRSPPAPASLRLPLRSKVEFLRAMDASSIGAALRVALAAVDDARRAGEPPEDTVGACCAQRRRRALQALRACVRAEFSRVHFPFSSANSLCA